MNEATESLSDRARAFEINETEARFLPGIPLLVQFDGVSFHNYTQGLEKPFSKPLHLSMVDAAVELCKASNAACAYTQSDEITLVINSPWRWADMYFMGRKYKVVSVLTSICTHAFNLAMSSRLRHHDKRALFDGHGWNVPTPLEAVKYLQCREQDATNNSLLALAQSLYSHRELQNRAKADLHDLLHAKGVNWNDLPPWQKRGTWVKKVTQVRRFTEEEIAQLPPKHAARANPGLLVERSGYAPVDLPQLSKVENLAHTLFEKVCDPVNLEAGI